MPDIQHGILRKFVASKEKEMERKKAERTLKDLERGYNFVKRSEFSMALRKPGFSIIAEIKYQSPSRGRFPCRLRPVEVADQYEKNCASALSVLTDEEFFAGHLDYLREVTTSHVSIPVLCKDFIVDEYQIMEAALAGASAFLLIVACLSEERLRQLIRYGRQAGLESLIEVHTVEELQVALDCGSEIIGVNNRNLDTLEVDVNTSFRLAKQLKDSDDITLVSESGLTHREQLIDLWDAGYEAFLIGTSMMNSGEPGRALATFLEN